MFSIRGRGVGLAIVAGLMGFSVAAQAAGERVLYASLGDTTRSPIGWVEFCSDNPGDCRGGATQARVVRHLEEGFAIEFVHAQLPETVEDNVSAR